jgi:hypothetical protein
MSDLVTASLFCEFANADRQLFRYSTIHVRFQMRTYGGSTMPIIRTFKLGGHTGFSRHLP